MCPPLWLATGELMAAMVTTDVAGLLPGVTNDGEKEQLSDAGKPPHVSATALLKASDRGATVSTRVPVLPDEIVSEDGAAPKVKPLVFVPPPQLRAKLTAPDI